MSSIREFAMIDVCPGDAQLGQFLSGRLTDDITNSLCEHIDACDACQQRILHLGSIAAKTSHLPVDDTKTVDFQTEMREGQLVNRLQKLDPLLSGTLILDGTDSAGSTDELPELGSFEPQKVIGRGGMGVVYQAVDHELNREVAVKLMKSSNVAGERGARFRIEAEVAGGLEHPGIVPVYCLREDQQRMWYAMRLVRGTSLHEAVDEFHVGASHHKDPPRALLRRLIDACHAVAFAHSKGVLHRDLKPANIMLGKFGETLVVDWGLAKRRSRTTGVSKTADTMDPEMTDPETVGDELQPTVDGQIVGTPAFMSPEQAAGDVEALSPASDLYSLGATLFYVLTAQLPVRTKKGKAGLIVTLEKVRQGHIDAPIAIKPDVPKPLNAICVKAMALRPEDRYASAEDLIADLERYLADETVHAYVEPLPARARRWMKRNPTPVAVLTASVLLGFLAVGAVAAVTSAKNGELSKTNAALATSNAAEQKASAEARRVRTQAELARDRARNSEAEIRRNLYDAEMLVASQAAREPGGLQTIQQIVSKWSHDKALLGWEWHFLGNLIKPRSRVFSTVITSGKAAGIDVSPDGKLVAVKPAAEKPVALVALATGKTVRELPGTEDTVPTCIRFSPDGTLIAVTSFGGPGSVHNVETGRQSYVLAYRSDQASAVDWSCDGNWLLRCANEKVLVHRATDGKLLSTKYAERAKWVNCHPTNPTCFVTCGYGNKLAIGYLAENGEVKEMKQRNLAGRQELFQVDWKSDGTAIAFGDTPRLGNVQVDWHLGNQSVLEGGDASTYTVSWSPDGELLATAGEDRAIRIYRERMERGGEMLGILRGHTRRINRLVWTPDSKQLLSASDDQTVRLWNRSEVAPDIPAATITTPGDRQATDRLSLDVQWSHDGKALAVRRFVNTYSYVVDTTNTKAISPAWMCPGRRAAAVAWSPNDRWLAAAKYNTVVLLNASDGTEAGSLRYITKVPRVRVEKMRWSPDGQWIAFSHHVDGRLFVCDRDLTKATSCFEKLSGNRQAWCWTPDGNGFFVLDGTRQLQRISIEDGEPETLATTTDDIQEIGLSPDQRWLALAGENLIELRDATTFQLHLTLLGTGARIDRLAWSPDSRRLASLTAGKGTIGIWNIQTGGLATTIDHPAGGAFWSLSWSPDGKTIAAGDGEGRVHLLVGSPVSPAPQTGLSNVSTRQPEQP